MAAALTWLGITPGNRVALLLNDSPEFIASFIAIASSEAIAVPINMGLRLDEQQLILNDCGASVALVESGLCGSLLKDAQEQLRELKEVLVVRRGDEKEFALETRGTQSGHEAGPRIRTLSELFSATEGRPAPEFPAASEDTPAFIL